MTPQKFLHNALPWLVGLFTFALVMLVTDGVRKTTEDRYLDRVEQHQKAAKDALKTVEENRVVIEDLQKKVATLAEKNTTLEKQLTTAKTQTSTAKVEVAVAKDSLKTAQTLLDSNMVLTTIVTHQDVVITSQGAEIKMLEAQKENLTQQIAVKDSINAILLADNERLETVVATIPPVDKCANKFLFCKLNKPSRVTSFIGGAVTTVVAGVLIR